MPNPRSARASERTDPHLGSVILDGATVKIPFAWLNGPKADAKISAKAAAQCEPEEVLFTSDLELVEEDDLELSEEEPDHDPLELSIEEPTFRPIAVVSDERIERRFDETLDVPLDEKLDLFAPPEPSMKLGVLMGTALGSFFAGALFLFCLLSSTGHLHQQPTVIVSTETRTAHPSSTEVTKTAPLAATSASTTTVPAPTVETTAAAADLPSVKRARHGKILRTGSVAKSARHTKKGHALKHD